MSKSKSPVPQKRKRRHDEKFKDSPSIKHKSDRKEGYEKKRKASERSSESPEISNRRTDSKKEKRYRKDESSDRIESRSKNYERYWGGENVEKTKERERYVEKDYQVGSRYYEDPKEVKVEEENKKPEAPVRQKKEMDLLTSRTGGAYIPPARLKMMQAEITDKSSAPYQRISWEALKKSIHGCINKINTGNIGTIIKELLRENIVRGRGLLCRSIIQAQAASPTFTHVYSALVSAINSRFPNIGELLLKRLVIQFKRGFKRNDKSICISAATFIAHLVNQKVAHEILALEILTLLVESPTDDSVEVSIAFLKECGQKLTEVSAKGVNAIFEMLRNILHEGQLDKRVQYMIEVMFQVRKDGFKDHVAVLEELELVPEEDQFTHLIMLDEVTDPQDLLNVFKFDPNYEVNEGKYKELSSEILGSDAESNSDEESGSGSESDSENDEENQENTQKDSVIIDNTETNLIALRRTIYLTIHSSLDFEECAHKLMKMQLKPGQEMELCHMFLDCCAEQRTYEKFYGLLAQRFCQINRIYVSPFEQIFKDSYGTAHRLDTNRLRNISKFFAHLLFTDAIGWEALDCVKLNEEDTTSSSRIFIKIMFQELAEYMGLGKLNERLKDPTLQGAFAGIFPRDNPRNTRFAINFFTSIGLGGLTDELREHLKQVPKTEVQAVIPAVEESSSSSGSSSSSESDSSSSSSSSDSSSSNESSSDSNSSVKNKKKKKKEAATKKKKNINEMNKEGRAMTRKNEDERSLRNIDEQDSHRGKGGGSRRNEDERQWGRNEDEIMSRKNDNERMSRNIDDERMERRKDNERPYRKNDERMERRNEDERPSRKNDDERMERRNDYERMERRNEDERPSRKHESKGMARRNEDERWSREGMERRNDDERPYRKNDNERMARRNEDERMERRHDDERPSRKNDERMERRNDYERTERRNDDKSSRKDDDERMERRNENVKPSRKNGDKSRYDNEKSTRNNEDERKDRKKGDDKSSRKYENEKSRRIEEEDEEPSFYRNESKNVKEKRSSKRDEEKGSSKHKDKSRRND